MDRDRAVLDAYLFRREHHPADKIQAALNANDAGSLLTHLAFEEFVVKGAGKTFQMMVPVALDSSSNVVEIVREEQRKRLAIIANRIKQLSKEAYELTRKKLVVLSGRLLPFPLLDSIAEEELDFGIHRSEVLRRDPLQILPKLGADSQHERFTLCH